jgi:hypothetical protein
MNDLCLIFPDEATMLEVLNSMGMLSPDGVPIEGTHQYALNVIGYIAGSPEFSVCANLRVIDESFDTTPLDPYVIHPQDQKYVWA